MIQNQRVKRLNTKEIEDGDYVVYWMQCAQRTEYNHALEYAALWANKLNKPLVVYFGLTDYFPEATERHYYFMLQGLQEVQAQLKKRNIKFLLRKTSPEIGALKISKGAAVLVVDRGYLRIERYWRDYLAQRASCAVIQVETNVVVPIEEVSNKEEYAAATIRNKIYKVLDDYIVPLKESKLINSSLHIDFGEAEHSIDDLEEVIASMKIDKSVKAVKGFKGGTSVAKEIFEQFIEYKLDYYDELKNAPGEDYSSNMSPYLHFGQISPLYLYLRMLEVQSKGKSAFLEELLVRRELSMNFVYYNCNYDSYKCAPDWAKKTLEKHIVDLRHHLYSLKELEEAKTYDEYWNAAQHEMVFEGKMHGYMRMYWAKKILEWSESPEEAFKRAIYLNNKYSLDGRDANAFTGVAWCFGKHDRPWTERNIFGMVRYMNDSGLKRKFKMDKYLNKNTFKAQR